jgi:hypothetical protein
MTGISKQRLAVTKCTDDDISAADFCHPTAGQFQVIVSVLTVQNLNRQQHAFLARNFRTNLKFAL